MAAQPEEEDQGGSYLGLASVLIVVLGFLTLLVWAGVGPLKKTQEAEIIPAPVTTPAPGPLATGTQPEGNPPQTAPAPAGAPQLAETTVLTRIAVGGGIDQTKPIPILSAVLAKPPQVFVFTGDAVAADALQGGASVAGSLLIAAAYGTLDANPDFKSFKAAVPMVGTWGGRDYGQSGAGASFPYKTASKEAFLQFYAITGSTDRAQHDGVYGAYTYGPEGQRTQIILLDTRSFRSDLKAGAGAGQYVPDPDPAKTMLGAEQWAWLEQQLIDPADVRLIVSPIPIESEGASSERWGDLPAERDHLYDVLRRTGARGVVLVSGDRGTAAIYKDEKALAYPLYEISSSGLNTPLSASGALPPADTDSARTAALVTDANFGIVAIDWPARAIGLEIHDKAGGLVQGQSAPFPPEED